MDTQTQAQIYLADQRGYTETDFQRSYHTFNAGTYFDESRQPFGPLHALNDDTLRAGAALTTVVPVDTHVILIPVTGGLEYQCALVAGASEAGSVSEIFLEPGQAGCFWLPVGTTYSISNPYETEAISFLQLWLTNPSVSRSTATSPKRFDLSQKNRLLPLFNVPGFEPNRPFSRGFIGHYSGRQSGTHAVQKPAADRQYSGVFVFVLQGAFEVQNRLLHARDGLSLQYGQADIVEFEALSNDALLIMLDY